MALGHLRLCHLFFGLSLKPEGASLVVCRSSHLHKQELLCTIRCKTFLLEFSGRAGEIFLLLWKHFSKVFFHFCQDSACTRKVYLFPFGIEQAVSWGRYFSPIPLLCHVTRGRTKVSALLGRALKAGFFAKSSIAARGTFGFLKHVRILSLHSALHASGKVTKKGTCLLISLLHWLCRGGRAPSLMPCELLSFSLALGKLSPPCHRFGVQYVVHSPSQLFLAICCWWVAALTMPSPARWAQEMFHPLGSSHQQHWTSSGPGDAPSRSKGTPCV